MKERILSQSFLSVPIAHRGLFNETFPENSIPAFYNAIKNGFPIELDVQLTKDNKVVVFHDATLLRMTGEIGLIKNYTYENLQKLSLKNSNEKIPLLSEALSLIDGKVPILIEIKKCKKRIIKLLFNLLKDYKGEYALQSFYPFMLKKAREKFKGVAIGQLVNAHTGKKSLKNFIIFDFLMLKVISKPQFISMPFYHDKKKINRNKYKVLAWTVKNSTERKIAEKFADNIIFENLQTLK